MAEGMLIVQTEPRPGAEADFNAWYDDVHLPEVLTTPGFTGARRFRTLDSPFATGGDGALLKYVAIYDVAGLDLIAAHAALLARIRAGELTNSDTVVAETYRSQLFEQIATRP